MITIKDIYFEDTHGEYDKKYLARIVDCRITGCGDTKKEALTDLLINAIRLSRDISEIVKTYK